MANDSIVWFRDYRIVPTEGASQDRSKQLQSSSAVKIYCDDIGVVANFTTKANGLKEYRWAWDAIDTVVNVPRNMKK
jgi:hypothetical protein